MKLLFGLISFFLLTSCGQNGSGLHNTSKIKGDFTSATPVSSTVTLASITPSSGSSQGGTVVTLTGSGFLPGARVSFDSSACTGVTVVSDLQLTCLTPAHGMGKVNVNIANITGRSPGATPAQTTANNVFTYEEVTQKLGVASTHAGGVISTGTGIQNRATLGEITTDRQSAAGKDIQFKGGVQGVVYDRKP